MKYKILFNSGSEGCRLLAEEFDSIDEAVKKAIMLSISTCSPHVCSGIYSFDIITIVDWQVQRVVN